MCALHNQHDHIYNALYKQHNKCITFNNLITHRLISGYVSFTFFTNPSNQNSILLILIHFRIGRRDVFQGGSSHFVIVIVIVSCRDRRSFGIFVTFRNGQRWSSRKTIKIKRQTKKNQIVEWCVFKTVNGWDRPS